ncbi:hypothetical protein D3C87_1507830 [compost metagenome]
MLQLDFASLTVMTRLFGEDMRKRGHGKMLLVASMLLHFGMDNIAVYGAAEAYVLLLGDALHRDLKRDGVPSPRCAPPCPAPALCRLPGRRSLGRLKMLMMKPAPVMRADIHALHAGRMSLFPGFNKKGRGGNGVGDTALAAPGHLCARHERLKTTRLDGSLCLAHAARVCALTSAVRAIRFFSRRMVRQWHESICPHVQSVDRTAFNVVNPAMQSKRTLGKCQRNRRMRSQVVQLSEYVFPHHAVHS